MAQNFAVGLWYNYYFLKENKPIPGNPKKGFWASFINTLNKIRSFRLFTINNNIVTETLHYFNDQ